MYSCRLLLLACFFLCLGLALFVCFSDGSGGLATLSGDLQEHFGPPPRCRVRWGREVHLVSPWVTAPIGDRGWWVVVRNRVTEQLGEEVGAAPSLDESLPAIPLVQPPGLPSMVEIRPPVPLGPFCFLRRRLQRWCLPFSSWGGILWC
jgi:hypothetical protein